ncbi:hypothetical protein BKA58DRAFT_392458 [Alternaria rosae]|uniref:uncharacterized protein n=1 Tax=Alternaria rosae TaxID=1187941 RepID=UPI001E8E8E7E|nr:uncharacterized protein BKA58DRAFT_392458 [Alternaria rosae]KAH6860939.1 hypothetical protein BKA58DRAFT_392458 [Alternaria rosae]
MILRIWVGVLSLRELISARARSDKTSFGVWSFSSLIMTFNAIAGDLESRASQHTHCSTAARRRAWAEREATS